jgi:hypothetical protein
MFFVDIFKSKTHTIGYQVKLQFQISQHSRDAKLIRSLEQYFNCGRVKEPSGRLDLNFVVTKFSDIESKIIPFLKKYPLQGAKRLDFESFVQVAEIFKIKGHLTAEGFQKIQKIKSGMNTGRV